MKSTGEKPDLIPYYLIDDKEVKVCPKYFNDTPVFGDPGFKKRNKRDSKDFKLSNVKETKEVDPFQVNTWLPAEDPNRISTDVIEYEPNDIIDITLTPLMDKLRDDLDGAASNPMIDDKADKGWTLLNKVDFLSTRQFFQTKGEIGDDTGIYRCGYNFNTIEWFETYAYATGWCNQSFAETVFETLEFDSPKGQDASNDYWYCVEGGTPLVAEKMAAPLKKQPEFNEQVTAINTDLEAGDIKLKIKTTKPDNWDPTKPFKSEVESRSYFTVFNSTTLGALQRMDLSKARLLYSTKQAIRSLNYGASCKVGIQFEEMWWMGEPWNIDKGGNGRTNLPIRVCVYPSYNIHDPKDKRGVLLCSYSWAQDAPRIGTLIDPRSPNNEDELKELLLFNLAQLHAKPKTGWDADTLLRHLRKLYVTHHAYDWYHDPNMAGAFAYFGPGQFSQIWPEIIKPNGWLFLIGEASSAHHGWIVGALESSVPAVYQLLHMLNEQAIKKGRDFSGYEEAMTFLAGPKDELDLDWEFPFVGLPREIPVRQKGTEKGKEVQETPEKDDVDLSFIAAQCITSFFEMMIEVAKEEKAEA